MEKFIFKVEDGIYQFIESTNLTEAKKIFRGEKVSNKVSRPKEVKSENISGIGNNIIKIKDENFFSEPRTIGNIKDKLAEVAVYYPLTSFPYFLNQLVSKRILRRYKQKIKDKEVWVYVNP